MPRGMVALLAAVATAMLALAALAHGALFLGMVADAVFANGLVAYVTAPALTKKSSRYTAKDRERRGRSQGPLEHSKLQAQVWPLRRHSRDR